MKKSIKSTVRVVFIMISFLLFHQSGVAQQDVVYDTAMMRARTFDPASINRYKADPAFQFEQEVQPSRSLWTRFWAWFWQKVSSLFGNRTGITTFKTLIIILAVSVLVFFIMKLTGMSNMGLFGKKNKEDAFGYTVVEEDIHGIDFDAAIEKAIADKNFRFAVRLMYLRTLKNLADLGLINWQVNKTNIAYVDELNGNDHQAGFRDLTRQFENNWYGYLPIEETEFRNVMQHFNQFNQKLS